MRRLRMLKRILSDAHTSQILFSYAVFILLDAMLIYISDPNIHSYADSLWYCYAVISTIGFGDITVISPIAKLASVLLTVYSVVVIAIVTGVIVNYYNQLIQIKQKETLSAFIDNMERLPELSHEELCQISDNVKAFLDKEKQ